MKYNINKKEKNQVEITISLDKDEWLKEIENAYETTKGKFAVQGFRKGKAPRKAIENAYGSNVFLEEALQNVFDKYYGEVLDKEDLSPIEHPNLSMNKFSKEDFEIVINTTLAPEVKLGKYNGLEIEKTKVEVSDDQVDARINQMRENSARKVEVIDRTIENGDIVNLDFSGSIDGVKFDGGTAQGYELVIGSKSFIEGFEDQMVGMKVNEEKDIKVKFPTEYHSTELAGKDAVFAVKVNKIEKKELPELNDEWASNVSEFETINELREDIKKQTVQNATKRAEDEDTNKIIDKIVANAEVDVPAVLVERELDYMLDDLANKLSYQGAKLDDYFAYIQKTKEDFRNEQKDIATANVKMRLVIEAIIKKENIKVEDSDLDAKFADLATKFNKSVEEIKNNFPQEQRSYFLNEILMDKLIAYLKANNKIA